MAIYRCEVKNISRGQGRSCVAAAAYRHAEHLRDERQQMDHSYVQKEGVEHSEIVAPENAQAWTLDREKLWNTADAAEKRKDARTAKEVLVALPRELNTEQQAALVRDFAREEFASKGLVADFAIHAPDARDGEKQPHAHIMLTTRALEGDGFAKGKDYSLDKPPGIEAIRERWAQHCNRALERAHVSERVDHRSLADQRKAALEVSRDPARPEPERVQAAQKAIVLNRRPEPKIGPVAQQMDRQGRGEKAHSLRDAMQARSERSVLQRLSRHWGQVRQLSQAVTASLSRFLPLPIPGLPGRAAMMNSAQGPGISQASDLLNTRQAEKILQQRQEAAKAQEREKSQKQERGWDRGFSPGR